MIKNKAEKLRFSLVGVANTTIDFTILFTLSTLGVPVLFANIASTSAAFCFSFFANKKYTFKASGGDPRREIILFIIVTLFGLWVLQTVVIKLIIFLFTLAPSMLSAPFILVIAKILATITSLIWNYILYSRVVFKGRTI